MMSFGTMLTIMLNDVLKLDLQPETIQNLLYTCGIYVGGQGIVDMGLAMKGKYEPADPVEPAPPAP